MKTMAYTQDQIKQMIVDAAVRNGIDPNIALAQARQESGYNPSARSGAGALGVMQLMPSTAADLGVRDPLDPAQNIDGGMRYLKQNLDRYGGDYKLALAAYNAGPGNVDKHGGVPPFRETQGYVRNILGSSPGEQVAADAMKALGISTPTSSAGASAGSGAGGSGAGGGDMAGLMSFLATGLGGTDEGKEKPSWLERATNGVLNRDRVDRLQMAIEGLRMNPNEGLIQTLRDNIAGRKQEKRDAAARNRTAAWLEAQGRPDLAAIVASGGMDAGSAVSTALSASTQNISESEKVRTIKQLADLKGLTPGTPEYQKFVDEYLSGANAVPSDFLALDRQARAAGFKPASEGGDGQYEEFMKTRGQGYSAGAREEAKSQVQSTNNMQTLIDGAQAKLDLINRIRTSPALDSVTGLIQGSVDPRALGQDGADLAALIDQLRSQAFLQAFESLRGGGAITEIEGQKATDAIANLSRIQSKEAFLAQLATLENTLLRGINNAYSKSSGYYGGIGGGSQPPAFTPGQPSPPPASAPAQAPAPAGGQPGPSGNVGGITWRVLP